MTSLPELPILVLDSGVGGLTVLAEIQRLRPDISCHYLADRAFFPYGTKNEQILQRRLSELIARMLQCHELKAVVIACNSASTAVLDCLRAEFEVPFVGVVPAIKPAALCSGNKKIGLLATQGTVTRAYIDRLINEFAADCEVVRVGSQLLVELAEQKLRGETVTDDRLLSVIQPLLQAEVDVVVLGCTHFPWFKADFQRLCPQITWLDSGQAIARRVDSLLPSGQKKEPLSMPGYCYFTGQPVMLEPQILAAAGIRFAEYRQF